MRGGEQTLSVQNESMSPSSYIKLSYVSLSTHLVHYSCHMFKLEIWISRNALGVTVAVA